MNRLLRVLVKRLVRDKIFLLAVTITFALSLFISLTNAPDMAEWAKAGEKYSLESCYYNLAPLLGLIYASFVSLFLGVEHSDGTLRNKLIAGHSRNRVFISLFIASFVGCLTIMTAWLIGGLSGLFYFDGFALGLKNYVLYAMVAVCGALLYAAVFTAMSVLIPNKAVSAVATLILWFVFLFIGSMIVNALNAPEMTYDYVLQGNAWVPGEPFPNPNYVSGMKRYILETLSHIIPVCPAIRMDSVELDKPVLDIVYSLATSAVILWIGCSSFRKKDLK